MRREDALTVIYAELAEHGHATQRALRAYIENRVSRSAFNAACQRGLRFYQLAQAERAKVEQVAEYAPGPAPKVCECGAPMLWMRSRSTGEVTESCERDKGRFLALYGEPKTFVWFECDPRS
jgi:hypothetical protein